MEKCLKVANLYIATLKAIYLIHLNSHWLFKGAPFYGNHLLFQRIYESAQQNLDNAAEKFIGVFGSESINFDLQTKLLHDILNRFKNYDGSPLAMSLAVEESFLKLNLEAYKCFEDEGHLTMGMQDLLPEIASTREEAIYLLKQAQE